MPGGGGGASGGGLAKKGGGVEGSSRSGGRCEVLLTCQGDQKFKDYLLECEESSGLEIVEIIKKIKTGDLARQNKDEEKPRRRYSLAGLKKMNRSSYSNRGQPH